MRLLLLLARMIRSGDWTRRHWLYFFVGDISCKLGRCINMLALYLNTAARHLLCIGKWLLIDLVIGWIIYISLSNCLFSGCHLKVWQRACIHSGHIAFTFQYGSIFAPPLFSTRWERFLLLSIVIFLFYVDRWNSVNSIFLRLLR